MIRAFFFAIVAGFGLTQQILASDEKNELTEVHERPAQKELISTALHDEDSNARAAAAEQIHDPEVLAKIALEDPSTSVFLAVIERIDNQAVLARIAREHKWPRGREFAVSRISDQEVLTEIVFGENYPMVRRAAAYRISNQDTLVKIALEDIDHGVRREAVWQLEDKVFLERVAAHTADEKLRYIALQQIADVESKSPTVGAVEFAKNEEAQPVAAPSPPASIPAQEQEVPAVRLTSRDNILTVLEKGTMSMLLEGSGTLMDFDECTASIRGDFVSGTPAPHTITCRLDSNSKGVRFYQDCKKTDFAGDIASLLAKVEAGEPIDATTPQQIKEHIGRQVKIRSVGDYCESFEMLQ